jgi:hypothetical protein
MVIYGGTKVAPVERRVRKKPRINSFLYGLANLQSLKRVRVDGGISVSGSQYRHFSWSWAIGF